jgi:hypothetical protein
MDWQGATEVCPDGTRAGYDAVPGVPIEVDRLVSSNGPIGLAGRRDPLGMRVAGHRITGRLDRCLLRLVADGNPAAQLKPDDGGDYATRQCKHVGWLTHPGGVEQGIPVDWTVARLLCQAGVDAWAKLCGAAAVATIAVVGLSTTWTSDAATARISGGQLTGGLTGLGSFGPGRARVGMARLRM